MTDPYDQFATWFEEAKATEPNDANAVIVATATPDGLPSARTLLLKDWDRGGFVIYTNKTSRKGVELAANPNVALLFYWKLTHRQIRIEGRVADVTDAEADAYFNSRARVSRLGAWASLQSQKLPTRAELERRVAEAEIAHADDVIARPPHWSGYRVIPRRFEFWQDMPFRLHDRTVFTPASGRRPGDADSWDSHKLYP